MELIEEDITSILLDNPELPSCSSIPILPAKMVQTLKRDAVTKSSRLRAGHCHGGPRIVDPIAMQTSFH